MDALYQTFSRNFKVLQADTPDLKNACHALRYQVYCVEHPYENPDDNPEQCERDNYDVRSRHALVRHVSSGITAGVVRLVLADESNPFQPFPMEELGIDLAGQQAGRLLQVPRCNIAEISRFAVSKEFKRRISEMHVASGAGAQAVYRDIGDQARRLLPHITIGLFAGIVRMSAESGITHWYAVMEPTLLRLLSRFGIFLDPIGPLVQYHGLRQPAIGEIDAVLAGIFAKRPEVWEIITDCGRVWPLNQDIANKRVYFASA